MAHYGNGPRAKKGDRVKFAHPETSKVEVGTVTAVDDSSNSLTVVHPVVDEEGDEHTADTATVDADNADLVHSDVTEED